MTPHPSAPTITASVFMIYEMMFSAITPALAFGAGAERMSLGPTIIFLFVWSTLVYDFIARWVWAPNGWLAVLGVMDYAGGAPVHVTSGAAAVAFALVLGKRKDSGADNTPHNVSFVFLGLALLWFGWLGFNGGGAMAMNARGAQSMINTHLSGCVGAMVWTFIDYYRHRKWTVVGFCTGAVAGLATITAGAGFVSSSSSLIFGLLGAIVCNIGVTYKKKLGFDDALDVFAVHYIGGFVGLLLTGIFSQQSVIALSYNPGDNVPLGGALDGNWLQLAYQLAAICSVSLWSFLGTYLILWVMDKIPGLQLRLEDNEEELGTDIAQMDEHAYGYMLETARAFSEKEKDRIEQPIKEGLERWSRRWSRISRATDILVGREETELRMASPSEA
jgi:Amt family ammonium transporter